MAGFSSLVSRTSLKHAVTTLTSNLKSPSTARNLATGGGIYGEPVMSCHSNGIRLAPFHHFLRVNHTNKPAFLRIQSMSSQFVPADSHLKTELVDIEDHIDAVYAAGGKPIPSAETKTGVFWDIEDYNIPDGLDAGDVSKNIKTALEEMGLSGPVSIKAYADETNQIKDHVFHSAGIDLKRISEGSKGKDRARDNSILVGMFFWAWDNREASTILVISDSIYIPGIEELKKRNHYVLWKSLSREGKLIAQTRSSTYR